VKPHHVARSFALLTLLAGTGPRWAWAAPPDPAPAAAPAPADTAAGWLRAGNKAFKDGDFAEAERAYREAFAAQRGYDIAGNLGAAELAQGKLREAAQHLAFTLRMFPVTGDPALREQMAKAYEQCRQGVGALRIKLDVKGATVRVDGAEIGEAALADEVFVDPGEHVVEARLAGYTGAPQRVTVAKGAAIEVATALAPVPRGVDPIVVSVRRRSLAPGLALAAGAAVGLLGGAAFLSLSASKRSDAKVLDAQILDHHGTCAGGAGNYDAARCPGLQSTLHADDAFHDVAVGAFVVGSAAAVAAATYFLWPQRTVELDRGVRVTPVMGTGDRGVVVSGSF
jgi:tetratricopeptide (TPR) repeat protein